MHGIGCIYAIGPFNEKFVVHIYFFCSSHHDSRIVKIFSQSSQIMSQNVRKGVISSLLENIYQKHLQKKLRPFGVKFVSYFKKVWVPGNQMKNKWPKVGKYG